MITWIALKIAGLIGNAWMARLNAIVDSILSVISFIFKQWRIFLPLAIVSITLLYIIALRGDVASANKLKVAAETKLAQKIQADAEAVIKRDAELKLNAILAKKKIDALTLTHRNELSAIFAKGKTNEAKLKTVEAVSDRAISNYRDSLRLAIEREAIRDTERLSGNVANRSTSANGDATISRSVQEVEAELATCKEAGAVAAADYNYCRDYVKSEQSIIGVRK